MKIEIDEIEQLEKFHSGTLNEAEREIFKQKLASDPTWQAKNSHFLAMLKAFELEGFSNIEQRIKIDLENEVSNWITGRKKAKIFKIGITTLLLGLTAAILFWWIMQKDEPAPAQIPSRKSDQFDSPKKKDGNESSIDQNETQKEKLKKTIPLKIYSEETISASDSRTEQLQIITKSEERKYTNPTTNFPKNEITTPEQNVASNNNLVDKTSEQQVIEPAAIQASSPTSKKIIESSFIPSNGEIWKTDDTYMINDLLEIREPGGGLVFSSILKEENPFDWDGSSNSGIVRTGQYFAVIKRNNSEIAWFRIVVN